jgi:hypothetical protein
MRTTTSNLVSGFDCVEVTESDTCPACGKPVRHHDFTVHDGEVRRVCHACHKATLRLCLAAVPVLVDEGTA